MKESTIITLAVIGGLAVAGYFIYAHYKATTPAPAPGSLGVAPTLGNQVGSTVDTGAALLGDLYGLYSEYDSNSNSDS